MRFDRGKLDGLDLFSGIGGLSLALEPWVRTIAYCERDRYAQAVLLSRMSDGGLERAPIWDDITSLRGHMLTAIDIIFGGFPCQDISVAGHGVGLAGKRSGLFFEILRLSEEIKPPFIFLENVPGIRTRGLDRVVGELSDRGYDSRWCTLSAQEVGANHKRSRWFLLAANPERFELWEQPRGRSGAHGQETPQPRNNGTQEPVAHTNREGQLQQARIKREVRHGAIQCGKTMANTESERWGKGGAESAWIEGGFKSTGGGHSMANTDVIGLEKSRRRTISEGQTNQFAGASWWSTEPNVGRVVNGLPQRVDRIRCLGNAVVPAQAREAFKRLSGM